MQFLSGILPATITPFDADGRFDRPVFEQLLERLYRAGVDGIYVCGSTGEGMLQPVAQRQAVVEAAVAATPRGRSMIVHVGAAAFEEVQALTAHAARAGAHAVSSLPPSAGAFGFRETLAYYRELARISELPVIVYFFPDTCPGVTTLAQLEELCAIGNVAGVKFTDFDLFKLSQVKRPERCVFNGRDEVLAAGLLMGADGGIGSFYNLVPERFVEIQTLANAGRWDEARARQTDVNALIAAVLRFPLFPAIKQILTWSGIACGTCLLPRGPLTEAEQIALRRAVVDAGFPQLAG